MLEREHRRVPAATSLPPAPRAQPGGPAARILALQRHAGNAAVGPLLQRKVGLELQTAVKVTADGGLKEGATLAYGRGWHAVADEVQGNTGDLEFVTNAFSDPARLQAAVAAAQTSGENIEKAYEPDSFPKPRPLIAVLADAKEVEDARFVPSTQSVTAAPQATWDVPLARLIKVLRALNQPKLGPELSAEPESPQTQWLGGANRDEAELTAQVAGFVQEWFDTRFADVSEEYSGLAGLSALVLTYLLNASGAEEQVRYAKIIAPVMSRTSFSSLWRQLSPRERNLFQTPVPVLAEDADGEPEAEDEGLEANFATWMLDMAEGYAREHEIPVPDGPVYPSGYTGNEGEAVDGPDTSDWLESIPRPRKTNEGRDLMSPPDRGSKSMGRRRARSAEAAVELRRLPKGLPVLLWTQFAARISALYAELLAEEAGPEPLAEDASPPLDYGTLLQNNPFWILSQLGDDDA